MVESKRTSKEERADAWAAFIELTKRGWRSDDKPLSRDELHERDGAGAEACPTEDAPSTMSR